MAYFLLYSGLTDRKTKEKEMPPTFTVTAEFTREGLLELRKQLDELMLQAPSGAVQSLGEIAVAEERAATLMASDKVSAIRNHLGEASWRFLRTCAEEFNDGDEFNLEFVADAMHDDPELSDEAMLAKVKAYHRNVTRSEKKVNGYLAPGVPPLLESRWDGGRNWYTMPAEVRKAIRGEIKAEQA